jgi:hypothetical protein
VLVGDRKVTTGLPGLSGTWVKKIKYLPAAKAVFGAAGVGNLFEEYLTLLPRKIEFHRAWMDYQNQRLLNQHSQDFANVPNTTVRPPIMAYMFEDFKNDCVEQLTELRNTHSVAFQDPDCVIQVLVGTSITGVGGRLYYVDSNSCIFAEVDGLVAIGQNSLAEVFRKSWDESMTMAQTAKLGIFAIKYIEQEGISSGIGIGSLQPQVFYLPNDISQYTIKELSDVEVGELVSDADNQVEKMKTELHSLFRS